MIRTKAKGSRRERQAKVMLESQGYLVMHAAASLGMFDLIAINSTSMRLIQIKSNRKPSPAEMEGIRLLPVPGCCSKEIWIFEDRKATPSITVVTEGAIS